MGGFALTASDGAGSLAMTFTEIPHNPARAGEGGVRLTGTTSTAWGAFDNIAAAPFSAATLSAKAGYQIWAPSLDGGDKYLDFGAAFRTGRLAFGLAVASGSSEPYTEYRDGGFAGTTFTPKDMTVGVGAAYGISDSFGIGLSAKFLSNSLSSSAAYKAFCVDIMGYGSIGPVRLGGGLRNLGGKVKSYSGTAFSLPAAASLGVGYDHACGFGAALDADLYFSGGGAAVSAGAHYCWRDMLTVRAGYHLGAVLPSYASVGLGVKLFGVSIDAAYLLASDTLGGSLLVGLGYSF